MKRRRNADNRLRRLERAVAATGAYEDVAAYWRACLSANILPKPTGELTDGDIDTGYVTEDETCWVIEKPHSSNDWYRQAIYLTQRDEFDVSKYLNRNYIGTESFETLEETTEAVKKIMRQMLEKVNPKRLNADDRLRRLQRQAESGDSKDTALYWRALLQAGITPEPTLVIPGGEETTRGQVWSLLGYLVEGYDICDARIVLRSRLRFRNGKNVWEPDMLTKWSGKGFRGSWDKQLDFVEPAEVKQLLHQTLLEHIDENS